MPVLGLSRSPARVVPGAAGAHILTVDTLKPALRRLSCSPETSAVISALTCMSATLMTMSSPSAPLLTETATLPKWPTVTSVLSVLWVGALPLGRLGAFEEADSPVAVGEGVALSAGEGSGGPKAERGGGTRANASVSTAAQACSERSSISSRRKSGSAKAGRRAPELPSACISAPSDGPDSRIAGPRKESTRWSSVAGVRRRRRRGARPGGPCPRFRRTSHGGPPWAKRRAVVRDCDSLGRALVPRPMSRNH